jgi:hypothetical protein
MRTLSFKFDAYWASAYHSIVVYLLRDLSEAGLAHTLLGNRRGGLILRMVVTEVWVPGLLHIRRGSLELYLRRRLSVVRMGPGAFSSIVFLHWLWYVVDIMLLVVKVEKVCIRVAVASYRWPIR